MYVWIQRLNINQASLLYFPSVDGTSALLCGCGDGVAGATREEARGVSESRACHFSATQVPDPEPAVCSAGGRISHC